MTVGTGGWDSAIRCLQSAALTVFDREPVPWLLFGDGLDPLGLELPARTVYRDANEQVEIAGTEVQISSDHPVLHVALDDLPRAIKSGDGNDELEGRSTRWKITDVLEDGEGIVTLVLAKRRNL